MGQNDPQKTSPEKAKKKPKKKQKTSTVSSANINEKLN